MYVANRTSFKPGVSGNPDGRPKGHSELKNKFFEICMKHGDFLEKIISDENQHARTRLLAYQLCLERGMGKAGPEPEDPGVKVNAEEMRTPELIIALQESVIKLTEENERLRSKVNEKTKD